MASRCRSCEAPVIWATTRTGKQMPLDETPDPKGEFVYVAGKTWKVELEDRALRRPTYTSHFATCPDADQHRRSR